MDPTEDDRSNPDSANAEVSTLVDPVAIGRYRVTSTLGQGGFGRVYLARDDELDRLVAIKLPNPGRVSRPEDVDAYLAEARILAMLDHPNIVPAFDVGRMEDGSCFLVSKYLEGSDLARKIREDRPGFGESAELIAKVAEALHYAHTKGLVHRDVKPANILIDAKGNPCVADFGLALRDEDFGGSSQTAGTPAYMSPEQARGDGNRVDGRSDVFSLGVVLYELLVGRRPFRGDSHVEVLDQIVSVEPRPPRQIDDAIPIELERVCLKAMSKHPAQRYTTALDMAEELRSCLRQIRVAGGAEAGTAVPASSYENRPAARGVRRLSVKGNFGRLGCGLELSLAMSLFLALAHISLTVTPRVSYAPALPSPVSNDATHKMKKSDTKYPGIVDDRVEKTPGPIIPPSSETRRPSRYPDLLIVALYIWAAAGLIWFLARAALFVIRPLIATKIPEDDESL